MSSDIYTLWDKVKSGEENNLKRYIKIQFKRLGFNKFEDIINIVNNDLDYLKILFIIISYYSFIPISNKI